MGDVSGKGPEAAALTSLAHYTIRAAVALRPDPKAVLEVLNEEILRHAGGHRFFSIVFGELEGLEEPGAGRRLKVASGGHPPPLVLRAGRGEVEALSPEGSVLGMVSDPRIGVRETGLSPGDAVLFYTDGVIEARDPEGEFFGERRLRELLRGCAGLSAERIAEKVEAEVMGFQRGIPRDDIALLVLRIL
jgi:sigma-B regulation protein RsbU (phosphoserine phosphatase)